jgi:hypothetical protein
MRVRAKSSEWVKSKLDENDGVITRIISLWVDIPRKPKGEKETNL